MHLCFILIVFITFVNCEDELIHVHAFWRHGERNPWILFNGDLNNVTTFREGLGQLTKDGIHQMYTLGQHFRARYIKDLQLLSPNYKNSEVYARSTDFDRALASAMAFFSGLYSNKSSQEHILAPVPVHSIPSADDFLNILVFQCPRKDQLWRMVDNSQIIQSLLNNSHKLFADVSNKTNLPMDFYKVFDTFDAAMVEEELGLPVLPWLSSHFPEWRILLTKYTSALWGLTSFQNESMPFDLQLELQKISGGSIVAEIVDRLQLKIKCENSQETECTTIKDQKFYAYSGHDLTELGLFAGLGFKDYLNDYQSWPDYGSTVVLELWKTDDVDEKSSKTVLDQHEYYYVKTYYYENYSVEEPKYIGNVLPECQGRKGCPLQYLIGRAELLRPKPDLKSYCYQDVISVAAKYRFTFVLLFVSFVLRY